MDGEETDERRDTVWEEEKQKRKRKSYEKLIKGGFPNLQKKDEWVRGEVPTKKNWGIRNREME